MKKWKLIILTFLMIITLSGCGKEETKDNSKTPTVVEPGPSIPQTPNNPPVEPTPSIPVVPTPITPPATPTPTVPVEEVFTIVWVNHDGEILETDSNVLKGSIPTYDGEIPTKEATNEFKYIFNGWTPVISEVIENTTYTAVFIEMAIEEENLAGSTPILSEDEKTVFYGLYPQTHVSDSSLIATLETLQPSTINNWYLYEGVYYCKETANVFKGEDYTFDNGEAIVNGQEYWFKCEPISWNIINTYNQSYYLVTTKLLDTGVYYNSYNNRNENNQIIYANNYEHSDIRNWLNNYFYNTAFALNNLFVQETNIDNGAQTSDSQENKYSCANTLDKVFLPSYKDYLNNGYGFAADGGITPTRECKTTDYARVRGAWYNDINANLKYNGTYWTRSSSSEYSYCAWNVNSGGYLSTYAVDGTSHCVRPSIYIPVINIGA